jgi:hypothetical protein
MLLKCVRIHPKTDKFWLNNLLIRQIVLKKHKIDEQLKMAYELTINTNK